MLVLLFGVLGGGGGGGGGVVAQLHTDFFLVIKNG